MTLTTDRNRNRFTHLHLFSGQRRIRYELRRPVLEMPRLTPTPTLKPKQAVVELLTNACCGD